MMSTYAIGDVQGCYAELLQLLDEINFDERYDRLWFAGDLVNRGPDSLSTIRLIKSLGDKAKVVLGNHDLHLLSVWKKARRSHKKDTLNDILNAEDSGGLLSWLRQQPLLLDDQTIGYSMVHAGIVPQWSLTKSISLARTAEALIKSDQFDVFIPHMYGNQPDKWSESLAINDRYRFIINCFTRIRYIHDSGQCDFGEKRPPGSQPDTLIPWYKFPRRKTKCNRIIFGHWSTVHLGSENNFEQYNVYPLDTGCLWGGKLTAMRLEDRALFSVASQQKNKRNNAIP